MTKDQFSSSIPGRTPDRGTRWLELCSALPGKGLHFAVALWLQMLHTQSPTGRITRRMMARVNISRYAASDALRRLEAAGLVKVWRLPGRSPMVTAVEPGTGMPLDLNTSL